MGKIAQVAEFCFCFLVVQVWFSLPSHVIAGQAWWNTCYSCLPDLRKLCHSRDVCLGNTRPGIMKQQRMNLQVFHCMSICTRSLSISAFHCLWAGRAGHSFVLSMRFVQYIWFWVKAILLSSMERGSKESLLWIWRLLHLPWAGSSRGGQAHVCRRGGAAAATEHYCITLLQFACWQPQPSSCTLAGARSKQGEREMLLGQSLLWQWCHSSPIVGCCSDERESSRSLQWLGRGLQDSLSSFPTKNDWMSDPAQVTVTADMWACS